MMHYMSNTFDTPLFRYLYLLVAGKCYLFEKSLKDTHRKKAMSNKTPALAKSMNIDIWVVGTSNQCFVGTSNQCFTRDS